MILTVSRALRRKIWLNITSRFFHLEPGEENLAIVVKGSNDLELEVRTITQPRQNEVLVRVGSVCLTNIDYELSTYAKFGNVGLNNPVVMGSHATGIVVKPGTGVNELFQIGDRIVLEPGVSCTKCQMCHEGRFNLCPSLTYLGSPNRNGALCRFVTHPIQFCHKLPDHLSLEIGTMTTKVASSIHAYRRADLNYSKNIMIIGAGQTGLTSLMVAKKMGVGFVFCLDINDYRLNLAKKYGAEFVLKLAPTNSPEYPEYLKEVVQAVFSGEPDVTLDTVGTAASLAIALELTKSGGKVLLMNIMGQNVQVPFIHTALREIDVLGAYGYSRSSFQDAIKMLEDETFPLREILPARVPLEKALDAFSHARATTGENILIIVRCFKETESDITPSPLPPEHPTSRTTPPPPKTEDKKPEEAIETTDNEVKEADLPKKGQMENELQKFENMLVVQNDFVSPTTDEAAIVEKEIETSSKSELSESKDDQTEEQEKTEEEKMKSKEKEESKTKRSDQTDPDKKNPPKTDQ